MSQLSVAWRIAVANNSGLAFPAGGLVVRYRRWKFDSSGVLTQEASEQTATVGASLANGSVAVSSTIDNNSAGLYYLGASFILTYPALTGTTSSTGTVTVYMQRSTDGGTNWPDLPDNARGFVLGGESYVSLTNPASRESDIVV